MLNLNFIYFGNKIPNISILNRHSSQYFVRRVPMILPAFINKKKVCHIGII